MILSQVSLIDPKQLKKSKLYNSRNNYKTEVINLLKKGKNLKFKMSNFKPNHHKWTSFPEKDDKVKSKTSSLSIDHKSTTSNQITNVSVSTLI